MAKNKKPTNELATVEKQSNPTIKQATDYKAVTLVDYNTGSVLLTQLNGIKKTGKAKKDLVLQPILTAEKEVRKQWKPFEDTVESCITQVKKEMGGYLDREEERAEREREKVLSDKRTTYETKGKKLDAITMTPTANTRNVLKLNIYDPQLIPREYLEVNETAVRAALREGKDVPGARLDNEKIITV